MFSDLPPLNQLRGFEAAARLGSFKAAGDELHVSPTAISHQIATLEARLGILLFDRKIRSVQLTSAGAKLALASNQALQQLAAALEEISSTESVLRIATTTSFASLWLVPNLTKFYQQHHDIHIEISTSEDIIDINRERHIDLAIRYGCYDQPHSLGTPLITERFNAYATPGYLAAYGNDLRQAVLIETTWKNQQLPAISWYDWLQQCKTKVVNPEIRRFDQEQHVIQAALAGQGIALASTVLTDMAVQQGWLAAVEETYSIEGLTYYYLVSPSSAHLRKVKVFHSWLVEALSL